jgi:uncharacterized protein YndB with AHSA1/START domain
MAEPTIVAEPGVPRIVMTAEFDAPREHLFLAFTDPDLIMQWLGPRRLRMKIDEHDPRDGGKWRYIHRDPEGNEYCFHGVFHGAPSLDGGIVRTFEYEGAPGHVSLETVTFEDRDGRTLLVETSVYQSVEDRDAMIDWGMEEGANDSMERLEVVVTGLRQAA